MRVQIGSMDNAGRVTLIETYDPTLEYNEEHGYAILTLCDSTTAVFIELNADTIKRIKGLP